MSSISGTPTTYGRACITCARAKAKCVVNYNSGPKCERCRRLNKDCQLSATTRKRKTPTRKSGTKVDRLEEKLDGLVTLLKSTVQPTPLSAENETGSTDAVHNQLTPESMGSLDPSVREDDGHEHSSCRDIAALTTSTYKEQIARPCLSGMLRNGPVIGPETSYAAYGTRSSTFHSPDATRSSGHEPTLEEADEFLDIFKAQMIQYSPFIIIPVATTAQELRSERPFLWLCIMAIATKSTEQSKILGREIRLAIGREILLEGKNNLDLLIGILAYTAWGHYHIFDKSILSSLVQLAIGIVGALGLKKLPPKEPPQMMLNFDARGCPRPLNPSPRTMEERRSVIGCYWVSSVVSTYFQRIDPLRWTPYLDDCLQVLADEKEYPTDILLVQFVRLQLIVEKVGQAPWHDGLGDNCYSARAPSQFYMKAVQAQLQDFKKSIPPELVQNGILLLHIHHTELVVHETALSKGSTGSNSHDFERLESLYACLHAVKNWFDIFQTCSPAVCVGLSMSIFTHLAHCIIALYRLSTFEFPDWNLGLVREIANLSLLLDRMVTKMAQVKVEAGLDRGISEEMDIFSATSGKLDTIKTWWDSKQAAESTGPYPNTEVETMGEVPMDFPDDAWLQDILAAGPYGFESFV